MGRISAARAVVQAGRRVCVLTGAGISTASGIPDYRYARDHSALDQHLQGDPTHAMKSVHILSRVQDCGAGGSLLQHSEHAVNTHAPVCMLVTEPMGIESHAWHEIRRSRSQQHCLHAPMSNYS